MSANSKSRAEAAAALAGQNQPATIGQTLHGHSNSTSNLNLLMAETIASQQRPFHHAKSGSTSAVSRNLNKSCKESFTTICAAKTKEPASGQTSRPILNQVLNKMLENSNLPNR
jgi:hypothetical protein